MTSFQTPPPTILFNPSTSTFSSSKININKDLIKENLREKLIKYQKQKQHPFPLILMFSFLFSLLVTCSTGAPHSAFYDASINSFSEPAFSVFLPTNSRSFVGIRTLRPSKAVFGFRQLRESLAEHSEQRRELRKTRELEVKQGEEELQLLEQLQNKNLSQRQPRKYINLQRRQKIYDRLLCIATFQNLSQCRNSK
uniref:Uncharacterized protein n=3 Tax=Meloidogyne TaxID=189290 RepID=A0A6V7XPE8_MELEN|nr:unnamed protein product [Meloidogyne enterolobii]